MNKNWKMILSFVLVLVIICVIGGFSYSYFTYFQEDTRNNELIAGNIYLEASDNINNLSLTEIYPETSTEARNRQDNYVTFNITGENTSNKNIYYSIELNNGPNISGKTRFNPSDIRFDLIETVNNQDTYVIDNQSFNDFSNRVIYVGTVKNTDGEVERSYKLRMWLSDTVTIGNLEDGKTYSSDNYEDHYFNVSVSIHGDTIPKEMEKSTNVMGSLPTVITNQKANITKVYFIEDSLSSIDARYERATIKADVTATESYSGISNNGNVKAFLENDPNNNGKYYLYVVSNGTTYLTICENMFDDWSNVIDVDYKNVDSSLCPSI